MKHGNRIFFFFLRIDDRMLGAQALQLFICNLSMPIYQVVTCALYNFIEILISCTKITRTVRAGTLHSHLALSPGGLSERGDVPGQAFDHHFFVAVFYYFNCHRAVNARREAIADLSFLGEDQSIT